MLFTSTPTSCGATHDHDRPLHPAPVLADSTPFVPGMALWCGRFGEVREVRDHMHLAPLEWIAPNENDPGGWFLGCHSLAFFHGSRAGAKAELLEVIQGWIAEKEARIASLQGEITALRRRMEDASRDD